MEGLDVDMEELESRLYSQVYHSAVENHDHEAQQHGIPSNVNVQFKRPSRYFQVSSITRSVITTTPEFIPLSSHDPITNPITNPVTDIPQDKYRPIFLDRYYRKFDIMEPAVMPRNNVIIVPPIDVLPNPARTISPNIVPNRNLEKYIKRQEKIEAKKLKNIEKRKRYKQKKMLRRQQAKEAIATIARVQEQEQEERNKVFMEHSLRMKPLSVDNRNILKNNRSEVVVLLESDNSDCEVIPEKRELVVLSSDDDDKQHDKQDDIKDVIVKEEVIRPLTSSTPDPNLKEEVDTIETAGLNISKNDDDVIFIEPEPKCIEIIEIDCDSISASLKDDEKHSETASTNSDVAKIPAGAVPQMRLRNELRTPDSSASNDFLDNTVDLNHSKFNFSLHGTDFVNTKSSTKSAVEMSETDTTSTTSDAVVSKTNHFNTVDFETPTKRFFDGTTNLESFGNYITPNRDNSVRNDAEKDSFVQVCTKACQRLTNAMSNDSSDDSSSESDYDDNKVSYLNSKQLPQLSNVDKGDKDLFDIIEPDKSPDDSPNDSPNCINLSTSDTEKRVIDDSHVNGDQKKRKSEDFGAISNKKRKTDVIIKDAEPDVANVDNEGGENNTSFSHDITIENNPNFIIIDETFSNETKCDEKDDDDEDTDSYFSCDDFNNITADLKLGNCEDALKNKQDGKGRLEKLVGCHLEGGSDGNIDYLNYSVEKVQQTMSDNPEVWKILDIDRLHFRYETPRGPRCRRCREIGHMAVHCTNKQGPRPCILCGERGHQDHRCPLAMCTSCGNLGGYTTSCNRCVHWKKVQCHLCKLYGHIDSVCPDLWRRYHLTIKPGPIVKPIGETIKSEKDRWCSLCSKLGHLENKCNNRKNRTHPTTNPRIQCYVDLYNFPKNQPFIFHKDDDKDNDLEPECKQYKDTENKEKSTEKNKHKLDKDNSDAKIIPEDCSFHDAETGSPDIIFEDQKKNEQNTYFNVDFPPMKFIPDYFLKQMNNLKEKYLGGGDKLIGDEVEVVSDQVLFKKPISFLEQEYISFANSICNKNANVPYVDENINDNIIMDVDENTYKPPSIKYQRNPNAYDETLKLNYLQFAYVHTDQGILFFNSLKRRRGLVLIVDKYDDSPGGEIYLKSRLEIDVQNVRNEILQFFRDMPSINDFPQQSKEMLDFLEKHKNILDRAEGNCWTLCKQLCKLQEEKSGSSSQTAKLKDDMQVKIQLLLFGKLNVGSGSKHVKNIQRWINRIKNKPNYRIPLNDIYDIQHSYSYIFEPRKSIHPFKSICWKYNHYIRPTVEESSNQKQRKMPMKNRIYFENKRKYVIDTCKRYNFPNRFLNELKSIQNAMESSQYSRVHYGDFLRFMTQFRAYMKKQRIS